MTTKDDAIMALLTFGSAVVERLDQIASSNERILMLLEERRGAVASSRSVEDDPVSRREPSVPTPRKEPKTPLAKIKKLDAYHMSLGVPVVRLLLQDDVRPVGKVTKSIASEINLSETATKRLINVLVDALPFLSLGGGLFRVRADHLQEAQDWLAESENIVTDRTDFGTVGCSQLAFDMYAPKILTVLLTSGGLSKRTNELYAATGIKSNMFRGVMNRLLPEGFIKASISARGAPPTIFITDENRARAFLAKFPGYTTQEKPWNHAFSPSLGLLRLREHLSGQLLELGA